jgi:hypothetical protein
MRWVAPTEKDTANETLEKRLWARRTFPMSVMATAGASRSTG